jgi:uncharacterized membrane protein
MWDTLFTASTFLAAIGSGLIAGVFFAFSTFVMKALGRLPTSEGMPAMQSINVVVINPIFLGVFIGTALACGVAAVGAFMHWERPGSGLVLMGVLFYLIGTFLVTMVFNVPLNDALAAVLPSDPAATGRWADYRSRWTTWNHVRTIAALAAMVLFVIALRR